MRRQNVLITLALGMIFVVSLTQPTPSRATTVEPCGRKDRNITFLVPAAQVPAFQNSIRDYAAGNGLRYFRPEPGSDGGPVVLQILTAKDWSLGIIVMTLPGNADALASFEDETACEKRLPRAHADAWKRFIAYVEGKGYRATRAAPEFLGQAE